MILHRLRGIAASAWVVLWSLLALVWLVFACSCGPMIYGGSSAPKTAHFCVVLHNTDVAFDTTATLSWWRESSVLGSQTKLVPKGGEVTFVLPGSVPDGFELDTVAWPADAGGAVWQSPDYSGTLVFHVSYPRAYGWRDGAQ